MTIIAKLQVLDDVKRMNGTVQEQMQEQIDSGDKFLTKTQVAALFQVTPRTIDEWMKRGLIDYYKPGPRTVRFRLPNIIAHWDNLYRVGRGRGQ